MMAAADARHADELTVILIGSLGSGKSSVGNSILGRKLFKVATGTVSITKKVETESVLRDNLRIFVTDTPGLLSSSDFPKLKDDLKRASPTEKVTYALVIQIGRYTTEESQLVVDIFKKKNDIQRNTIIIFTNKEALDDEDNPFDRTIDGWLQKNPTLLSLIHNYKLKYQAFQNKRLSVEDNDTQVGDLISAICERDQPKTVSNIFEHVKCSIS